MKAAGGRVSFFSLFPSQRSRRTHCKMGHELVGANARVMKDGHGNTWVACRTCRCAQKKQYLKTEKGRAQTRRRNKKRRQNPVYKLKDMLRGRRRAAQTRTKIYKKRWAASHKYDISQYEKSAKRKAQRLRWMSTPKGQKYVRANRFKLPANAPDSLIEMCELLLTLKKELFNEHQRT